MPLEPTAPLSPLAPSAETSTPARMDSEAFRHHFDRFFPSLVYFFQRQGFTREEGQDLAQETFLRVNKGMSGFRQEARFETWLFKIAGNLASNARRYKGAKRRQHDEVPLEDERTGSVAIGAETSAGGDGEQLEALLAEERARLLHRALEALPPKMKRVLLLRIHQGLKYREVAELEGISIETVKAHLHQAKKALEERMNGKLSEKEARRFQEDD